MRWFSLDAPGQIDPASDNLIVRVETSWTRNPNTATEYWQFPAVLSALDAPPVAGPELVLAAYPNPARGPATVAFRLEESSRVGLSILHARGALVRTLQKDVLRPAGDHAVSWDGRDGSGRPVAAGVYFYRLELPERTATRKLIVIP